MPELITESEGDGSMGGGRETSRGFAHMCTRQNIPTACESDSTQIRIGYSYLHGQIISVIRISVICDWGETLMCALIHNETQ